MDLGIDGKKALVCAASAGLGRACAEHLAEAGVIVTLVARRSARLEEAAEDMRRAYGADISTVAADITTEDGRTLALAACPDPAILINNAGGPPPGDFRDWDREAWVKALDANMLTPIELIKATIDTMIENRFGRIINITSGMVKAPEAFLGLSNGARTGLTGFVAGLARETAVHNVTINNLLPGAFDTDRLKATLVGKAKGQGITVEQAADQRRQTIPAGRFGAASEFGAACAFLCSDHAGFITGQNLLMDGGAYRGTF